MRLKSKLSALLTRTSRLRASFLIIRMQAWPTATRESVSLESRSSWLRSGFPFERDSEVVSVCRSSIISIFRRAASPALSSCAHHRTVFL